MRRLHLRSSLNEAVQPASMKQLANKSRILNTGAYPYLRTKQLYE